jgi:hypothetical protein
METVANLEADYADFVETYITEKGSSVGADALWRQYKSEQVFPEGKYNPMRADWASWLAERGMSTESGQGAPAIGDDVINRLRAVVSNPAASEATKAAALVEINKLLGQ